MNKPSALVLAPRKTAALVQSLRRYKGVQVLVAISGGLDSVALVQLLLLAGVQPALAHVNYRLRGADSETDSQLVRDLANTHKLKLHRLARKPDSCLPKTGVQEWARKIRHKWFARLCKEHGYLLLTAHHQDDWMETLLMNLSRGTGTAGVANMAGDLGKPLLHVPKADLLLLAKYHKWQWREDASNATYKYQRNRVRHHVLPALDSELPKWRRSATASQTLLGAEVELLSWGIEAVRRQISYRTFWAEVTCWKLQELRENGLSLEVLHLLLKPYGFSYATRQNLIADLQTHTWGQYHGQSAIITSYKGQLFLMPKDWQANALYSGPLEYEAADVLRKAGFRILTGSEAIAVSGQKVQLMATEAAELRLGVPVPGGTIKIPSGTGTIKKKIKDLLAEAGVPPFLREAWPTLYHQDEVVALVGLRVAAPYIPTVGNSTATVVVIEKVEKWQIWPIFTKSK